MVKFNSGEVVEILVQGKWEGPYTVTGLSGRTPDHLVLLNEKYAVYFEHYNDAPYNTRKVN